METHAFRYSIKIIWKNEIPMFSMGGKHFIVRLENIVANKAHLKNNTRVILMTDRLTG